MRKDPLPLSENTPVALQQIVMKSLSKPLTERYQTALAMRNDLQIFLLQFFAGRLESHPTERSAGRILFAADEEMHSVVFQTAEVDKNLTNQATEVMNLPANPQLKPRRSYTKFLSLAVVSLILLTIGSGYYLFSSSSKNALVTNQSPSANLEGAQLVPFLKNDKYVLSDRNKKIVIEQNMTTRTSLLKV